MKLWLLEILACPIDHAFPLELIILKWQPAQNQENPSDKVAELLDQYSKKIFTISESPIHTESRPEGLFVRDFLVLKFHPCGDYFHSLIEKIAELGVVQDKSEWKGQQALELIKTQIKARLKEAETKLIANPKLDANQTMEILQSVQPELIFLNLFKYQLEIEDGVMFCPECHRWFPIFETIPQMLPDDLRQAEQDNAFQYKWASKIQIPK